MTVLFDVIVIGVGVTGSTLAWGGCPRSGASTLMLEKQDYNFRHRCGVASDSVVHMILRPRFAHIHLVSTSTAIFSSEDFKECK
ncbi:hypothetical protein BG74_08875 [Sodalis-like endosymbiont of Proechinophthirus fluctus]|nr:hypothetical protein BG74_08875 [Sodalis-like endosymbiont of Proechinophthirus fluctus]